MADEVYPMKTISSASELREKIEAKRYDTFTFPVLEITIKYRKPDLLKLSLQKQLPAAMADAVIEAYKQLAGGTNLEDYKKEIKDKTVDVDTNLIQDVSEKGYTLLEQLCVSHSFKDVSQSDFENNLIAWNDVPEEDAVAFLITLVNSAQSAATTNGGEVSAKEVESFPDGKRSSKRSVASKDG